MPATPCASHPACQLIYSHLHAEFTALCRVLGAFSRVQSLSAGQDIAPLVDFQADPWEHRARQPDEVDTAIGTTANVESILR